MDDAVLQLARRLVANGATGLTSREERVLSAIAKRAHVSRNINTIREESETTGDGLADKVAMLGGSWAFIIIFMSLLVAWVVLNTVLLSALGRSFDPYPFIFLNLLLSMVAAIQAPVILMSQNRQAARDRLVAGLDYEINLKSEIEIMALHEKLDRIRIEHLESLLREQGGQLRALLEHAAIAAPGPIPSTVDGVEPGQS